MTKVVDIEHLKNKYLHSVGTQFDNAIFVAENEFLIDAYTKADIVDMLKELQTEIEENVLSDDPNTLLPFLQARETCVAAIQQKISELNT